MPHTKTKEKIPHAKPKKIGKDTEIEPKKMVEADAPIILPELEEKIIDEEVPVPGVETEDEESEETPTIDEEDVNPFGDKWEQ